MYKLDGDTFEVSELADGEKYKGLTISLNGFWRHTTLGDNVTVEGFSRSIHDTDLSVESRNKVIAQLQELGSEMNIITNK
jgi:hypothetical protein